MVNVKLQVQLRFETDSNQKKYPVVFVNKNDVGWNKYFKVFNPAHLCLLQKTDPYFEILANYDSVISNDDNYKAVAELTSQI